jgi:YegS C-terminal NAD kinase beta sandwich-like domain
VIERGAPWGNPTSEPADLTVRGGDAELADAVRRQPGARIAFEPDETSDLARALGLTTSGDAAGGVPTLELPVDVLALEDGIVAVNAVVLGAPPAQLRWATFATPLTVEVDGRVVFDGRATTVVVASGEFLEGDDLAPRGHPGDGRAEVQVFALQRGERRAMRDRLADGSHVPHPRIAQASGKDVVVHAPARVPVIADGRPEGSRETVRVEVRPGALILVR